MINLAFSSLIEWWFKKKIIVFTTSDPIGTIVVVEKTCFSVIVPGYAVINGAPSLWEGAPGVFALNFDYSTEKTESSTGTVPSCPRANSEK